MRERESKMRKIRREKAGSKRSAVCAREREREACEKHAHPMRG